MKKYIFCLILSILHLNTRAQFVKSLEAKIEYKFILTYSGGFKTETEFAPFWWRYLPKQPPMHYPYFKFELYNTKLFNTAIGGSIESNSAEPKKLNVYKLILKKQIK